MREKIEEIFQTSVTLQEFLQKTYDAGYVLIEKYPSQNTLFSMGLRYRHDFGYTVTDDGNMFNTCFGLTEEQRKSILVTMRQLYETVADRAMQ